MENIKVIVVTGPTATGKTSLGVNLALKFKGEIISADSRQVYKGLDLGTGKDLAEYYKNGIAVPFHLIDIVNPNDEYNLKQFNSDAIGKIREINHRGFLPLVVGGSPLYIDSLISKYKFPLPPPNCHLRSDFKDKSAKEIGDYLKDRFPREYSLLENKLSRPRLIRLLEDTDKKNRDEVNQCISKIECQYLLIAPYFERSEVHRRIELRMDQRLKDGMMEEVRNLHETGVSWERLDSFGLEYRYLSKYLKNELSYQEMRNTLLAKIRQFARSQDVWFRKMEKEGHNIYWIPQGNFDNASEIVSDFLSGNRLKEPAIKISEIFYGKKQKN
jgi:tRNA dimethylallyltransferase